MSADFPLLVARELCKTYRKHKIEVPVLTGLDLTVWPGEFLCIVGASGSGKSTLLHLLGTLDQPDRGTILLDGERIDQAVPRRRDQLRNNTFGFIFQFYHLLPEFTALENVLLPQLIRCSMWSYFWQRNKLRQRAIELLQRVGLGNRLHHRPCELSGGEMQRASIARALMSEPRILFADEPTGNLDEEKGREIVELLRDLNREQGLTIIMVTHNMDLVTPNDRVVRLSKGRVEVATTLNLVVPPPSDLGERHHPLIDPRIDPLRKAL